MHINSIEFNSTKSMHSKEIIIRVTFLRLMYVIIYSIMNIMIENIKTKTMFESEIEINYMFKRLIDAV